MVIITVITFPRAIAYNLQEKLHADRRRFECGSIPARDKTKQHINRDGQRASGRCDL